MALTYRRPVSEGVNTFRILLEYDVGRGEVERLRKGEESLNVGGCLAGRTVSYCARTLTTAVVLFLSTQRLHTLRKTYPDFE